MGDLLVKIDVQVPTELDSAAREALEKFRDATNGANPREELLRKGQA
jgi:molecular chaperone DnaJ